MSQLPAELLDWIVGYLTQGRDLKACSLASRALKPRARLNLNWVLVPRSAEAFQQLLSSPECKILDQIRSVEIRRYYWTDRDKVFEHIAPKMVESPYVEKLKLTISALLDDPRNDMFLTQNFLSAFPNVTYLELSCKFVHHGQPDAPARLADTIAMFPALRELVISSLDDMFMTNQEQWTLPPPPALSSLTLCPSVVGRMLSWLDGNDRMSSVTSLTMPLAWGNETFHPLPISLIARVFAPVYVNLQHLDIKLEICNAEAPLPDLLNLSRFPALRTVVVTDFKRIDLNSTERMIFDPDRIATFLTRLQAASLETLDIAVDVDLYSRCKTETAKRTNWGLVDAHFAEARFARLRRVTLKLVEDGLPRPSFARPASFEKFAGEFPLLAARGLFRFIDTSI
ncbi:hypothetical protein MKEN_00514900 [Mycena kentingensis (nom. inval.)]|nr:hypothetical protein MKEN_00514900 [Mycena kentingensis (nom. inval.)]